jgi:hypothetical protein
MSTSDLDVVLARLETVVADTVRTRSRAGYFAAMYRRVTIAVRDAVIAGRFDDNDRMARLDRVFAERYLDAYDEWQRGGRTTAAWEAAFVASGHWRPIIIQHLLVGINAHINLDLGIAAATVAPGSAISGLRADFGRVNDILSELVDGVMDRIGEVSPWVRMLDRIGGRTDQTIVRFSIGIARDQAWDLAEELATTPTQAWDGVISRCDSATTGLTGTILRPGPVLTSGLFVIRLRESNDVPHVIDLLGS